MHFIMNKQQQLFNIAGLENDEMTPTLKQLWSSVKQLQHDMSQIKSQINEERELRCQLQQLLMDHLDALVKANQPC